MSVVRHLKTVLSLAAVGLIATAFNNCGNVQFTPGQPAVQPSEGTTIGNPMIPLSIRPYQVAAVPWGFKVCVERVMAKDGAGKSVDLFVGPQVIDLKPEGTDIPMTVAPAETYYDVFIEISNNCGDVRSALLCNSNSGGACFNTTAGFKLQFTGTVTRDGSPAAWPLDMQPIVDQLQLVTAPAEIAPRAEAVPGTF